MLLRCIAVVKLEGFLALAAAVSAHSQLLDLPFGEQVKKVVESTSAAQAAARVDLRPAAAGTGTTQVGVLQNGAQGAELGAYACISALHKRRAGC